MASKFDEEKRVLINDLTEEKAAHMQTLDLLAEEKRKSAVIPKLEQDLASLRVNFEEHQKMLIQSQKKNVEERNKNVVANQQIEQLQMQLEQLQEANDKTQSLLEENMQALDEHKALIQSNPNLQEIQEASSGLSLLKERVAKLESDLASSQEENVRMSSLLASAQTERDRVVEEMKGSKTYTSTLQAQLEEAMFNLEMSAETIKDLSSQLSALGVTAAPEDSPALTRSTANLLEQENARLSEEVNNLKANLVATETKLTRTTKQLNAFRLSASHDAKRNQTTITSLQQKIARQPGDPPSPSSTPEPPASPATVKHRMNGAHEGGSEGEDDEAKRREIEELQSQLRDAQVELDTLRAKRNADARAISEAQDIRMQFELSQTELEAMRADLERVEKELERKQTEAYTVRTQLAEELESLRVQVVQLQDALRKEEQANADLEQELGRERVKGANGGDKQSEIDELREQLRRVQEAHDISSDEEVVSLRAKVDESEAEVEKLSEELKRLKDNLETEARINAELTRLIEQEKSNHDVKQAEIDALRAKLKDSERDLQAHAHQSHLNLEESLRTTAQSKEELDRITNEHQVTVDKLNEAQDELDKLRVQIQDVQDDLERAVFDKSELEKKLEQRAEEEEAHSDSLRSQLQQSQDDFEKASDANAELERQLEHALGEVEVLKAGLKTGENEQLDALRAELSKLLDTISELEKRLAEEKAKSRARELQVNAEREELRAQLLEYAKFEEKWNQAKENLERSSNANSELEKQYNLKQVELNTHRANMLAQEREMELLRVQLLQAKDGIEKEKHTNLELERQLEEERNRIEESEKESDNQEQIESLQSQLQEARDSLEREVQANLNKRNDEQNKLKKASDDLQHKEESEFERQLALLRAEEGVLRAQLQAAQDEIEESKQIIEEKERERDADEQEREELASMIESLQKANEELANTIRKSEGPKPNGKQPSPRKVTIKEEPKSMSSESEQEVERELEEGEIIEDEDDEAEEEKKGSEEESEDEDGEDSDSNEELVAELQEQIKDEQQRTTNLVQAIYTLQIELQQEKAKQGEMDTALVELQRGNMRLTQEVYDLRNAWTESSFFNSSFSSDKGLSSIISEIPKDAPASAPSSPTKKRDGNSEWDGLENEIKRATGLRAVALRTILEDLENAKDKDIKMANLRTQQFQLIDKLNDTEVELAESRHMLSNLQNEYEIVNQSLEELEPAAELASKLGYLEQQNATLNARLEKALTSTAQAEAGHRTTVQTLESQIVNREQHNASINERLKEALGLATDAEEEHVKTVLALEAKLEKLEAKNAALTERLEENVQAAIALASAQEEYRKTVSALEAKHTNLEANNSDLNKALEKAEVRNKKTVEAYESKLVQLERRNAELVAENDGLERNAVSLAVHTNTTARDLEESVASTKAELADAAEEVRILLAERAATASVTAGLRERLEVLERLADNAEVFELRNAGLQRQVEELELQLRDSVRAKRERDVLLGSSDKLQKKVSAAESLEHRNAALVSITDELRQRINELESNPDEIETLSQEIALLEEERNTLTALNSRLEEECHHLREKVAALTKSHSSGLQESDIGKVVELAAENERLRAKVKSQEELHKNFVVATEEERAVNHNNFVNLQTALNDEKERSGTLEDRLAELRIGNSKLGSSKPSEDALSADRQLEFLKLREELSLAKSQLAQSRVENDILARIQSEMTKLKGEMHEERHKAKKWKRGNKELKEECKELKRDRLVDISTSKIGSGELGSVREEYATLRGECKVLREDRNIWREECSKVKDEIKKWREGCSGMELEIRELKIIHHEEVQLIASLKRENELLRRDNEMLWEQLDSWGALDGLNSKGTKESNTTNNNINIDSISTILQPDSTSDTSMRENKRENNNKPKPVPKQNESNNKDEEEEEEGAQLTRSHLNANGGDEIYSSPHPPQLHPADFPSYSHELMAMEGEEEGEREGEVVFEAQVLAQQRENAVILTQMDKLGQQLQGLVRKARQASHSQWQLHQAHVAHAQSQIKAERGSAFRIREAYELDSQRAQEASLEALRAHVDGIKNVYNALSFN